ncbi:hypothetical protein C8R44DRAFT_846434 [Mycena epipterygia]|nr:hypothetical protein C8R44DRAFT_846434 [Mycena epipterygia]
MCLVLHISLVLLHVVLLVIGMKHLEHTVFFSIELQSRISFAITAISTGIGIVSLASALFVTQKLAMHQNLQADQTLTATHDNVASWNGLGSAISTLFRQRDVPASFLGTLAIVGYLGCISSLHITTPALFSVAAFKMSVPHIVQTLGVPDFNTSANINATAAFIDGTLDFFSWMSNLDQSQTLGLFNGTLYDTLSDLDSGRGDAGVSATAFNMTCFDLPGVNTGTSSPGPQWNISLGSAGNFPATVDLWSSGPNVITMLQPLSDTPPNSVILYTTNSVIDSSGTQGSPVALSPAMGPNLSVTHLQFLQCSRTLVPQEATVDGRTGLLNIPSLAPSIYKTRSAWQPYTDIAVLPPDSTLMGGNGWTDILALAPDSPVPLNDDLRSGQVLSYGDLYLMDRLGLDPSWIATHAVPASVPVLNLHDIENSLSALVASVFWMIGHVQLDALELRYSERDDARDFGQQLIPPDLEVAQTIVPEHNLSARIEINLFAVSIGLALSLVLCFLALPYAFVHTGPQISIDNTGLLHTIWVLRNHPTLSDSLPQVADPLDVNLRRAGLIKVRLSDTTADQKDVVVDQFTRTAMHSDDNSQNVKSYDFRILCISLYAFLIVLHIGLLAIALNSHAEHRAVFRLESQRTASLLITLISTGFGTIYFALVLFITQRMAIQYYLENTRTLTAMHDDILSWAGLGSGLASLYNQLAVPASVTGTLAIAGYLSTLSFLHLTTPALFALQTFNQTFPATVQTHGIPEWNTSDHNATSLFLQNIGDFLPWMQTLNGSSTLGLFNGSLYEVLTELGPGTAPARVSAVGFNVSCGTPNPSDVTSTPNNSTDSDGLLWKISLQNGGQPLSFQPSSSGPNVLTMHAMIPGPFDPPSNLTSWTSLVLYATNTVLDSHGGTGYQLPLNPPMGPNSTVSDLQIFQCSQSLVVQHGDVDTESGLIIGSSLEPSIYKTVSTWTLYETPQASATNPTPLESGEWPMLTDTKSTVPLSLVAGDFNTLSPMDLYLMEKLGLDPSWIRSGVVSAPASELHLHDVENALSALLASYFWIAGHIQLPPLVTNYSVDENGTIATGDPPVLSVGSTVVDRIEPAARLNLNVIAVSLGLCASIISFLLALTFMARVSAPRTSLTGVGILQMIWLWRNHPRLAGELEQVEEPTDVRLRAAGMVRVQLVGGDMDGDREADRGEWLAMSVRGNSESREGRGFGFGR